MTLRRGTTGDTVVKLQSRLHELGFYRGPIDGAFGGGTESAVKSFQKTRGLSVDGCVGSDTWAKLFPAEAPPVSDMISRPLAYRCLALTGSFESSSNPPDCFAAITGDFDGQGISFGALQWNLGQGTLQPLLARMVEQHPHVCEEIFHDHLPVIRAMGKASREEQVSFARSIQDRRCSLDEPWRGMLKTLGRTKECQDMQAEQADTLYNRAVRLASEYHLRSQRGVALMFDILVQNGSISNLVKAQILQDYAQIRETSEDGSEAARMKIVALRRSAVVNPRFIEDVRSRKMTIAEGSGVVHGVPYDLEDQFGLTLAPLADASSAEV
jgi:hypothetical protein